MEKNFFKNNIAIVNFLLFANSKFASNLILFGEYEMDCYRHQINNF